MDQLAQKLCLKGYAKPKGVATTIYLTCASHSPLFKGMAQNIAGLISQRFVKDCNLTRKAINQMGTLRATK